MYDCPLPINTVATLYRRLFFSPRNGEKDKLRGEEGVRAKANALPRFGKVVKIDSLAGRIGRDIS